MKIEIGEGAIEIIGEGYTRDMPYQITFDRFDTLTKLINWISHLSEKTWWTVELTIDLISAYEKANQTIPWGV